MSKIVDELSARMARASSRRGFLGLVGKMTASLIAATSGIVASREVAHAQVPLKCCLSETPCADYSCPPGTWLDTYTWTCCYGSGAGQATYTCYDCMYQDGQQQKVYCTYPLYDFSGCQTGPSR